MIQSGMTGNLQKELLFSIRDTIQDFISGRLTVDEAREEYRKLQARYSEISLEHTSPGVNGFIRGLLYYHNVHNFSKITALYLASQDGIRELCHYGDSSLRGVLEEYIAEHIDQGKEGVQKTTLDGGTGLPQCIAIQSVKYGDPAGNRLITVAVSSSQYFTDEHFIFFSRFISRIFTRNLQTRTRVSVDYFDTLSKKIIEYIVSNPSSIAYIYIFHSIKEIFQNAAISKYTDISFTIQNSLKKNFRIDSKIFVLSLTQYLILTPGDDDEVQGKSQLSARLNFYYNDLLIPYETIRIETGNFPSIYKLWDQIFLIHNYITTGDVKS